MEQTIDKGMASEITPETAVKEEAKATSPGATKSFVVILAIVVSLASSLATVFAYDRYMAQKVVAVSVNDFLKEQRDLVLAEKITLDDFKANLARYMEAMKNQPKNKVLILEDVIASKNLEKLHY